MRRFGWRARRRGKWGSTRCSSHAAGFAVTKRAATPLLNAGYDPNTYSAGLIGFITAFVRGRQGLSESDATACGPMI